MRIHSGSDKNTGKRILVVLKSIHLRDNASGCLRSSLGGYNEGHDVIAKCGHSLYLVRENEM